MTHGRSHVTHFVSKPSLPLAVLVGAVAGVDSVPVLLFQPDRTWALTRYPQQKELIAEVIRFREVDAGVALVWLAIEIIGVAAEVIDDTKFKHDRRAGHLVHIVLRRRSEGAPAALGTFHPRVNFLHPTSPGRLRNGVFEPVEVG